MKYIQKSQHGLPVLEEWVKKKFPHGVSKKGDAATIWENFKKRRPEIKKELKETLLKEQGHLCAYCGRVIGKVTEETIVSNTRKLKEILNELREEYDENTIENALFAGEFQAFEHILSKSEHRAIMFDYHNLVAVCDGGKHTGEEHCDLAKWRTAIEIKPTDSDCEMFFKYEDGEIIGINNEAIETIKTLNLNAKRLKHGRKLFTIEDARAFIEELYKLEIETEVILDLIQKEIEEIYSKPKLDPFCFVKVYHFRTYL